MLQKTNEASKFYPIRQCELIAAVRTIPFNFIVKQAMDYKKHDLIWRKAPTHKFTDELDRIRAAGYAQPAKTRVLPKSCAPNRVSSSNEPATKLKRLLASLHIPA
jgi:hypothetical protein